MEEISLLFCENLAFDDCSGRWVVGVYHDHQTACAEASKQNAEEAKRSDENDEPVHREYWVERCKVK